MKTIRNSVHYEKTQETERYVTRPWSGQTEPAQYDMAVLT